MKKNKAISFLSLICCVNAVSAHMKQDVTKDFGFSFIQCVENVKKSVQDVVLDEQSTKRTRASAELEMGVVDEDSITGGIQKWAHPTSKGERAVRWNADFQAEFPFSAFTQAYYEQKACVEIFAHKECTGWENLGRRQRAWKDTTVTGKLTVSLTADKGKSFHKLKTVIAEEMDGASRASAFIQQHVIEGLEDAAQRCAAVLAKLEE